MKQPNTKKHWTALAVARYYEKYGTAARQRDLYPLIGDIVETPETLSVCLSTLNSDDIIDHMVVMSEGKSGKRKTYAYYPTNVTIDRLRDIGLPTKYPNGEFLDDDIELSLPTNRVGKDEQPEPPDVDNPPITRASDLARDQSGRTSTRTQTEGEGADAEMPDELRSPDYELGGLTDSIDIIRPDEDEEEETHTCECGREFATPQALYGHKRACPARGRDAVAHDEAYMTERTVSIWDWTDVANKLAEKSNAAEEAGLDDIATAYSNFSSLAMERDLTEKLGRTPDDNPLTREVAQKLLNGSYADRLAHSQLEEPARA